MGFFDKIKNVVDDAKKQIAEQVTQKQEEEKRKQEEEKKRQEEAKRKQEEANRFNPDKKSLEWFSSEDGIKTFNEYITAQNYLLEETIEKEHKSKYSEYDYEVFLSVVHKDAKLPSIYFTKLAEAVDVQALQYVGPIKLLASYLALQAKPFYIDDDGEPKSVEPYFTPEEIVSTDKNPILNFVKNFNCFELKNDTQGSWEDKWHLWKSMLTWLGIYGGFDKDIINKNPWIFSKEVYFNELGTVRKLKGFCKKCIELTTDEEHKTYFEEKYNECE